MSRTTDRTTDWLYIRPNDRRRFDKLAARETRKPVDQFAVLLDEACRARHLDPKTVEPLEPAATKNRAS